MNPIVYPKELRGRWYLAVDKHRKPVTEVCALFGIARKTYYKWYTHDHGQRPPDYHAAKRQPNQKLTPDVCAFVERVKRQTNYGPAKMQLVLKRQLGLIVSTTILYRFFKRRQLIRRPQKRLPWYRPLTEPIVPQAPGDLVEIDTKYVWLSGRRQYQRTFVDVFTGFQHAVVLPSLEAQATVEAFATAERALPFSIRLVQTDNGSENRGVFHQHLGQRGIAHVFIPKSSPNWNGAVERAHGTMDQEFYLNETRPWATLTDYLHWYNHKRIHLGRYLNGLTPAEKLRVYERRVLPLRVN